MRSAPRESETVRMSPMIERLDAKPDAKPSAGTPGFEAFSFFRGNSGANDIVHLLFPYQQHGWP